jgi:putative PIN family toxin of toxin-antitoxin system
MNRQCSVVVDTNVFVSALLNSNGSPAAILRLILKQHLELYVDVRIFDEYEDVLLRPKFVSITKDAKSLLSSLSKIANFISAEELRINLPDLDDKMFLEVAATAKVDYLISGNLKHYPLAQIKKLKLKKLKIISPAEFLLERIDLTG